MISYIFDYFEHFLYQGSLFISPVSSNMPYSCAYHSAIYYRKFRIKQNLQFLWGGEMFDFKAILILIFTSTYYPR